MEGFENEIKRTSDRTNKLAEGQDPFLGERGDRKSFNEAYKAAKRQGEQTNGAKVENYLQKLGAPVKAPGENKTPERSEPEPATNKDSKTPGTVLNKEPVDPGTQESKEKVTPGPVLNKEPFDPGTRERKAPMDDGDKKNEGTQINGKVADERPIRPGTSEPITDPQTGK